MMDQIQKRILEEVADLHTVPEGAYNIRANGASAGRNTTANIDIVSKTDVSGIDIRIKPGTKHESVHIPVVLSESGIKETVYNDFYIGEDSDIVIVAGCGIHNCGNQDSEHDGIHRFYVGKIGTGLLWLCTGGFFLIGTLVDLFHILLGKFRDNTGVPLRQ